MNRTDGSKILESSIELNDVLNIESIVHEQKQMPQYASVQKPSLIQQPDQLLARIQQSPHIQQPDQLLARIQQSTHCRNCKWLQ